MIPGSSTAVVADLQPATAGSSRSAFPALVFSGSCLLLFLQTFTLWIECIYRLGLTTLSPGRENLALLFLLLPLLILAWPHWARRGLLAGSFGLFVLARGLLPTSGVAAGAIWAGLGVGSFLVFVCLALPRARGRTWGNAGPAFGLALLASIALRAWGAGLDPTLSASGAAWSWAMVILTAALGWSTGLPADPTQPSQEGASFTGLGPAVSLWFSFAAGCLVLCSPAVIEAWLAADNTAGPVLCAIALGVGVALAGRAPSPGRLVLALWNLLFGTSLVSGILALRVSFPPSPESPALVVSPENGLAKWLLNLALALSPVVLVSFQTASRALARNARERALAVVVVAGTAVVVILTVGCIFTNVWGYVGPAGRLLRNQFQVPFLLMTAGLAGAHLLPGWRGGGGLPTTGTPGRALAATAAALVFAAVAGSWHYRPPGDGPLGPSKPVTVLTYNLQQGSALGGDRNWENQLSLLRAIDADLIGLQESDTARPSGGNVPAAKFFGAKLGYHIYYGPNTVAGTYGTAILSRFPLRNARTFFTFSDQDEVGTAVAELEVGGEVLAFFNSHPSGAVPGRSHARELLRQAEPYALAIAVGDFNATPQEEPYGTLTARFKDAWAESNPDGTGPLHPKIRPHSPVRSHGSSGKIAGSGDRIAVPERIDHIFLSGRLKAAQAFYLPAPASQTDHPAHWAVVTWD